MKTCTMCGVRKPAPKRMYCRACRAALDRARIAASRHWIEEYARRWRRSAGKDVDTAISFIDGRRHNRPQTFHRPPHEYYQARHDAIMAYGGYRCACCGEGEPTFLTIDHVNNGGTRHRRAFGFSTTKMFAWLRKQDYPRGFQVLCSNCNHGRYRNGGVCAHEKKRRTKQQRMDLHEVRSRRRTSVSQLRRSFK